MGGVRTDGEGTQTGPILRKIIVFTNKDAPNSFFLHRQKLYDTKIISQSTDREEDTN